MQYLQRIYKAEDPPVAEILTELLNIIWRKKDTTKKVKNAIIIHIFKRKGNPQACDNHRVISLLSVAFKNSTESIE